MENTTKQVSGSSSSSFTLDLFGPNPKDGSSSSTSSTSLFGAVFGPPPSVGLGRDTSHSGMMGSLKKQDLGSQYGTGAKHGTPEYLTQRNRGETAEPCYFNSSIYYGGQQVYSPNNLATGSQHVFKKDGGDDDPNGCNSNGASRGNWWQGSLYY